jgi:WD40 repeat protein
MNILPPCLCNRPQKSSWLKIQCSNCLGVLKDSQNINISSSSFQTSDTFSKSLIDYLSSSKSVHKRSCTDKQPTFFINGEKLKHIPRNPSDPLLIHKANQLSAPCIFGREYLGKEAVLYSHKNSVNSLLVTGSVIWTAGQDYQVISWNMPGSQRNLNKNIASCQIVHKRPISGMVLTSKECILTSSLDKTVKLWGVADKLIKFQTYPHSSPVQSLSTAGTSFISGTSDSNLNIWDLEKKKQVNRYEEHSKPVTFIENLKLMTFLSASSDCSVKLWDLRSERSLSTFSAHTEGVSCLKTLDPNTFLSGSPDKTVKTWDLRAMKMLESWDTGQEVNGLDNARDLVFVAGPCLQLWQKGTLLDETPARAKRVKHFVGTCKLLVGGFDNSVSVFKYFM